jgi:transcriptional regulator with GAF, ATPase, and Fis domain
MDDNEFFKSGTLLICGSLEIEQALWQLRAFLVDHLPADEIYLNLYETSEGALRYVARADKRGGVKLEKLVRLPPGIIKSIEKGSRLPDYLLLNDPEEDEMGRLICGEFGFADTSMLALRLSIAGQRVGVMDVFAAGRGRFRQEHAERLRLLREPISIAMANALQHRRLLLLKEQLLSDNRFFNRELIQKGAEQVVGASGGLRQVMESVAQVAPRRNTVLLIGETGVGKEVIATAIHDASSRRNEPFIKINCGAIPENLIDSELFGHEKGAFTGAYEQKRGRFERADKGTIFLDEIGELPGWAQVRLLRVLQTQEIERVGGSKPIPLDIRVLAATHRDLAEMVREGIFREDLWFRINAFPLRIPPLRERRQDIPLLIDHFLRQKAKEMGIHQVPAVTPHSLAPLVAYSWPGNVRELENVVERALIEHRQGWLRWPLLQEREGRVHARIAAGEEGHDLTLDTAMRSHLQRVLALTRGRISGQEGAAALLGVHPNTLRSRMTRLGLSFGRRKMG